LRPDTKGEHPGVVNKYSLGIWPIHKWPSSDLFLVPLVVSQETEKTSERKSFW
jgi:hypothetical protein